jgi:hypothetical protein
MSVPVMTGLSRLRAACLLVLVLALGGCQSATGGDAARTGREQDRPAFGPDPRGQNQWQYIPGSPNPILDPGGS